jgi:glycosyltransferase involved in cell wall biosynthesis
MKISVITVCFNAAATIRYSLDSFCDQSHQNKELLVIDGASRDETVAIVKSYARDGIRLVSEPDKGMYDALNKGLKLFTGDAFGVLNADDAYHDSMALARLAEGLEQSAIVQGHLSFVEDHRDKKIVRHWRGVARPPSGFKSGWMPAHPTFYVRREVVDKVGLFDLSMHTASDYDWMLRAVDVHGFAISLIDHVLIDMKTGGRSTSGIVSHLRHNYEALAARRRWLNAGAIDYALIAKPARKIGQFLGVTSTAMGS